MRHLMLLLKETRPQFLILTPACFIVGLGTASYALGGLGKVPLTYAILALLGALFSHITVNVLNDYFDYTTGLDLRTIQTPFSGGSGMLPRGLLRPKDVLILGLLSLAVVIGIGLYFLTVRGWDLFPVGLLGVLLIALYTPFGTRSVTFCFLGPGLGFGPVMVVGTHFVLTGRYDAVALWASFVPGFLVSNLLLINQFPDTEADRTVNRRHLPIVIGKQASAYVYAALAFAAYLWVIAAAILHLLPVQTLLALLPLSLAIVTIRGLINGPHEINTLIPLLVKNVIFTLATPFLLGIGLLIS
jgi:1,4-dihydroxy-2-naphthoate polyprenyltransferase